MARRRQCLKVEAWATSPFYFLVSICIILAFPLVSTHQPGTYHEVKWMVGPWSGPRRTACNCEAVAAGRQKVAGSIDFAKGIVFLPDLLAVEDLVKLVAIADAAKTADLASGGARVSTGGCGGGTLCDRTRLEWQLKTLEPDLFETLMVAIREADCNQWCVLQQHESGFVWPEVELIEFTPKDHAQHLELEDQFLEHEVPLVSLYVLVGNPVTPSTDAPVSLSEVNGESRNGGVGQGTHEVVLGDEGDAALFLGGRHVRTLWPRGKRRRSLLRISVKINADSGPHQRQGERGASGMSTGKGFGNIDVQGKHTDGAQGGGGREDWVAHRSDRGGSGQEDERTNRGATSSVEDSSSEPMRLPWNHASLVQSDSKLVEKDGVKATFVHTCVTGSAGQPCLNGGQPVGRAPQCACLCDRHHYGAHCEHVLERRPQPASFEPLTQTSLPGEDKRRAYWPFVNSNEDAQTDWERVARLGLQKGTAADVNLGGKPGETQLAIAFCDDATVTEVRDFSQTSFGRKADCPHVYRQASRGLKPALAETCKCTESFYELFVDSSNPETKYDCFIGGSGGSATGGLSENDAPPTWNLFRTNLLCSKLAKASDKDG